MSEPIRVLDTGALLAYAHQTNMHVPSQLAYCADRDLTMQTSVLCVAEAYRDCRREALDMLEVLLALPSIEIIECKVEDADMVGKIARTVERLSLAHSCLLVFAIDMPLMTTDAGRAGKVLESGLVWNLN